MRLFTDAEIEKIDAIAHDYIEHAIERRGNVDWLSSDERTKVRGLLDDRDIDAGARYQSILDIVEDAADQLAAADFLKGRDND